MDLLGTFQRGVRQYLALRGVASCATRIQGHAIHYYALEGTGAGPPLLLVHGLGGNANGFGQTFFPLARRFRRVVAVDLPGNGFSPDPPGGPLSLQEYIGVLFEFCERVVKEPAFVVGNSLGGGMCITLAAMAPQRVKALGLISPAGARVEHGRLEDTLRSLDVRNAADTRNLLRRLFHRAPLPALIAAFELQRMYQTAAVRGVLAELAAGASSAIEPELLGSLSMPVLLIWGASEKLLPYEGIDYFKKHLPAHSQVQVVKGFGHVPQVERPRALARALIQFADTAGL